MKSKIKVIIVGIMAIVILAGSVAYAAGGGIKKSIQVVINGINLIVDGQTISADNILYNGTTYVPVRALAEVLGKEVVWDAKTNTVEVNDKEQYFIEKNGIKVYAKTIKYKDEYIDVNIKIPVIEGMNNSELMDRLNGEFEKKALDFKKETEKSIKETIEEAKEHGWPLRPGSVYIDYDVKINDNDTMSISMTFYQFTGGAHGNTIKETVNLDLANGKELALSELFDSSKDYKQVLTDEILKQMNENKEILFPETLENFKASDDLNFYLLDDGIVFYFNQYEIATYASGIIEYKIPYDSLKGVLSEEYAQRFLNHIQ